MPARSFAVPLGSLKAANPVTGSRRNEVVAVDPRRDTRSSEYFTSVPVIGRPLLNFAVGLIVKSQCCWSGVVVHDAATAGWTLREVASYVVRLSNSWSARRISSGVWACAG